MKKISQCGLQAQYRTNYGISLEQFWTTLPVRTRTNKGLVLHKKNSHRGHDVFCECCVLSGRGLCDELIIRPEESYRLWCVFVCDLETSWMRRPWPTGGLLRQEQTNKFYIIIIIIIIIVYVSVALLCEVGVSEGSSKVIAIVSSLST